jgi:hypothetical protein
VAENLTKRILENIGRGGQEPNWIVEPLTRRLCQDVGLSSFIIDSEEQGDQNIT